MGRRLRRRLERLELSPLEAGVFPDEVRAPVKAGVVCQRVSWNELGAVAADRAAFMNEPLHLLSTPLGWLRAGGQGACVLDWKAPALWEHYLAGAAKIIAEDGATGLHLQNAAQRDLQRLPNIRVLAPMDPVSLSKEARYAA